MVQAQNLRPFVLFNGLIMVAAGGAWFLDDFARRHRAWFASLWKARVNARPLPWQVSIF